MNDETSKKKQFKSVRDEANDADMDSSPALNDDAGTDSGGVGKQDLPDGNRFSKD